MILSIERRATSARRTLCETLDTQFGGFSAGSTKKGRTRAERIEEIASERNRVGICGPGAEHLHMPFTRHVIQDSRIVT